jgi:hypothetical protein
VSPDQACALLAESYPLGSISLGASCTAICGQAYYDCELPADYVAQAQALNPDAGPLPADGGPRAVQCPSTTGTVTVTCVEMCTGRLTAGYVAPERADAARGDGERFADMAWLEAVSVHAFARLERELTVHGASATLLRDARRARRDEVRHTAMTARLARRAGGVVRMPEPPARAPVRSLFEIALENAVEGCVRETYGAVAGLVEARTTRDRSLRRAMGTIADDECRHAELAWAVHAWAPPRLSADERRRVERAMREAQEEIAQRDPRAAAMLFAA